MQADYPKDQKAILVIAQHKKKPSDKGDSWGKDLINDVYKVHKIIFLESAIKLEKSSVRDVKCWCNTFVIVLPSYK